MEEIVRRMLSSPDTVLILVLLLLVARDKQKLPLVIALGYLLIAPEQGSAEQLPKARTDHPDVQD